MALGSSSSAPLYRRISLPVYAAIAAGLILLAFFVYLRFTHGSWYDSMLPKERVAFWTEFGVSFGTIALALVTWASVYETQQVLRGEDWRFRQSRLPMIRTYAAYGAAGNTAPSTYLHYDGSDLHLMVTNDGDGPAKDVRLQFSLTTTYRRRPDTVGNQTLSVTTERDVLVSSYLGAKVQAVATIRDPNTPEETTGLILITVERLQIAYDDAFDGRYLTSYPDFVNRPVEFSIGGRPGVDIKDANQAG